MFERPLSAAAIIMSMGAAHAQDADRMKRGEYLVNAVMACDGCHTPRGPKAKEMRFSGGSQTWETEHYTVKGSNITPDKETGIGTWSHEDVKRALVEGVRPNGVPLAPQMPYEFYKVLTPSDLDAVVTYVKSVSPVHNEVQTPLYKKEAPSHAIPGGEKPIGESVPEDPVKRGFYLSTIAHCMECHARRPDGELDFMGWYGKGGSVMKGPWGEAKVANITSHPTVGIGGWSDAEVRRALTHGVHKDGRPFAQPMARHGYYSQLTEQDLSALVAWLRSIPPKE
jgi:mono/diheme cytochrome c family protein